MKPTRRTVFRKTLAVSAACAAVLTLPGLELYFANPGQFALGAAAAFALTLAAFLLCTAAGVLVLTLAKKCRVFRPGETVAFAPLKEYPQLVLPETAQFSGEILLLPQGTAMGVRIPRSERTMTLELLCPPRFHLPGTLTVRGENRQSFEFPADGETDVRLRIPVAAGAERIVPLKLEFTPRLRRRASAAPLRSIAVKSLRLD